MTSMRRTSRWLVPLATASLLLPACSFAFERDVHYYGTFALAIAVGWRWNDALVIASSNQGVDENKETVAALESDSTIVPYKQLSGLLKGDLVHQAKRNFNFHAFSKVPGDHQSVARDVLDSVTGCRQPLDTWLAANKGKKNVSPPDKTRLLIAAGTYLHCQNDVGSHQGFGGTCGQWDGSCTGHAIDTYFDRSAHRINPDHPYVKPADPNLRGMIRGTTQALWRVIRESGQEWKSRDLLPATWQLRLVDAYRVSKVAMLADDERIACHREMVGAWLREYLVKESKWVRDVPHSAIKPIAHAKCRVRAFGGATEFIDIPKAVYPRLGPAGVARRIDEKTGRYDDVTGTAKWDLAVESIEPKQECALARCIFRVKVQVANLGPSSSESSLVLLVIIPRSMPDKSTAIRVGQDPLKTNERRVIDAVIESPFGSEPLKEYVAFADIQPARSLEKEPWLDADIGNDSWGCTLPDCGMRKYKGDRAPAR